jgi:hypothetical protein
MISSGSCIKPSTQFIRAFSYSPILLKNTQVTPINVMGPLNFEDVNRRLERIPFSL